MLIENLKEVEGNLLEMDFDAIVHQANCFKRMKSGIAKSITDLYPIVRDVDNEYPYEVGPDRLGGCSFAICNSVVTNKRLVIGNLYGQEYYGRNPNVIYTQYSELEKALNKFIHIIDTMVSTDASIGIPHGMGCGLANGDWNIVYDIIKRAAINNPRHKFVIVRYDRA